MDAAGRPSCDLGLLSNDRKISRGDSVRKKKSLPNLLVLTRQKSQRGLNGFKSSPLSAGVDRSFHSDPSFAKDSSSATTPILPPLPKTNSAIVQERLAEGKRRSNEQAGKIVNASDSPLQMKPAVRLSSESRTVPSFSQRRPIVPRNAEIPGPLPLGNLVARPSIGPQSRLPHTASSAPRQHTVRPSQGELDKFDFRIPIPNRPHTATISGGIPSPKHESYPSGNTLTRPRQISDANSSWQRSPRLDDFVPPWAQNRDQNRGSSTSGISTGSSAVDTLRSSIFTKDSNMSEHTIDLDEAAEDYKDDIIDMYANKPNDLLHPLRVVQSEDRGYAKEKRRSMLIAQATELVVPDTASLRSSHAGTVPPSPLSPTTPAMDEEGRVRLDNHPQHRPPPLGEMVPGFDQYGFRKASREVSADKYDEWWSEYESIQLRRTERWKELMLNNGLPYEDPRCFPEPNAKTRRFVQKGIPPHWRGNAWFFYAGGHEFLDKFPGRYRKLLRDAQNGRLTTLDRDSIERDLHRTFPDNIHFKPDQTSANTQPDPSDMSRDQPPILAALRRVLSAFAVDHPKIGYCQSLNFLAGMLLLFLPEERAYWMLHIITSDILPGTHETSLEGANVDLWVLILSIRDSLPAVWQKLGVMPSETGNGNEMWHPDSVRLPPISLCTTSWFMSLFIGVLPTETTLRVWDMLFYDGARVLFRVALAIFRTGENEIKSIQDPMEIFQVVQSLPKRMIRCGVLMEQASNGKGKFAITNTWVDKQRGIRKDFFARERGAELARKLSKLAKNKDDDNRNSKESTATATTDDVPQTPPSTDLPPLDKVPTRKRSAWNVKRTTTMRKVTHTLA